MPVPVLPDYLLCGKVLTWLLLMQYFFTSFLSRDEAFKLIDDGWLQHNGAVKESADLVGCNSHSLAIYKMQSHVAI